MLRNTLKPIAMAAVLATGLAAGSSLYAQENAPAPGGMMGQGGMQGMMPMMGMMAQMGPMMQTCTKMMQAAVPAPPPAGETAPQQQPG